MNANEAIIQNLYTALANRDGASMAALYHQDAVFSDPVFTELHGEQIGAMWTMLCLQARSLEVQASKIRSDELKGSAECRASYEFGKPPRMVHNRISTEFEFQNGLIIKQIDSFNFWKWTRMALGPLGLFLGWHSGVRRKIQEQANSNLEKFILKTKKA